MKKKKKTCPVCGGRMRNGVCTWCGEKEAPEVRIVDESELSLENWHSLSEEISGEEEHPFWWEARWLSILLLIVCFPAGIIHMYAFGHFTRAGRNLITILLVVLWTGVPMLFLSRRSPLSVRYNLPPVAEPVKMEEMVPATPKDLDVLLDELLSDEAVSFSSVLKACIREGWPEEESRIAIEGRDIDFRGNALKSAEQMASAMAMSRMGVYEQLVSPYGEGFTEEEAAWAMLRLEADWAENAVVRAESWKELGKTREEAYELLTSEYGDGFTAPEAEAAVEHVWGPTSL